MPGSVRSSLLFWWLAAMVGALLICCRPARGPEGPWHLSLVAHGPAAQEGTFLSRAGDRRAQAAAPALSPDGPAGGSAARWEFALHHPPALPHNAPRAGSNPTGATDSPLEGTPLPLLTAVLAAVSGMLPPPPTARRDSSRTSGPPGAPSPTIEHPG